MLDGHEVVAEHQLDGDGAQQFVLNFEVLEVDEFGVITAARASAWARSSTAAGTGSGNTAVLFGHSWTSYIPLACPREKMGR